MLMVFNNWVRRISYRTCLFCCVWGVVWRAGTSSATNMGDPFQSYVRRLVSSFAKVCRSTTCTPIINRIIWSIVKAWLTLIQLAEDLGPTRAPTQPQQQGEIPGLSQCSYWGVRHGRAHFILEHSWERTPCSYTTEPNCKTATNLLLWSSIAIRWHPGIQPYVRHLCRKYYETQRKRWAFPQGQWILGIHADQYIDLFSFCSSIRWSFVCVPGIPASHFPGRGGCHNSGMWKWLTTQTCFLDWQPFQECFDFYQRYF